MNIKAIVTDIEGTTSAIRFVHDVLFPYARDALPAFVRRHHKEPAIAAILAEARGLAGIAEADLDSTVQILLQWIADDKKATPLKELQGHIWEQGYRDGDFTGHVYDDVAASMKGWRDAGILLYVYSSGSVQAQKLLFGHSDAGDLRPLFTGYFDTRIGQKREVASYLAIAKEIGLSATDILFLSDLADELDAASAAGMQTMQLIRDDDVAQGKHAIAHEFSEVLKDDQSEWRKLP